MIPPRLATAIAAVAAMGALGAAPAPPFRIAVLAKTAGPCEPGQKAPEAAARAYFQHLQLRLERPVLRCPVTSTAAGGSALAAGQVDMAALDGPAYVAHGSTTRALLTAKAAGGLARVPVILAVRTSAPHEALTHGDVIFTGTGAAAHAVPRSVLLEQGYAVQHELIAPNEDGALAMLRAGRGDAVAMHVGAWQRECRGDTPAESRCKDLKVVWTARQSATMAYAVRRDIDSVLRFRLLGIHIALHLENPAAFAWAAAQLAPGAENFEPAEAQALTTAQLR